MENPCSALVNPWGLGSVEILIFGDFFIGFWNTHVFGFTHRYQFFSTLRIDDLICTNIDVRSSVKNPCSDGNEKSSICKFVTSYQMCAYFSYLIPVLKSYGLFDYSKKWELRSLVLSLSMLTTLVSFRSHSIQFIVSAQTHEGWLPFYLGKTWGKSSDTTSCFVIQPNCGYIYQSCDEIGIIFSYPNRSFLTLISLRGSVKDRN